MKRFSISLLCTALLGGICFVAACDDDDSTGANTSFDKMEMRFDYAVSNDLLEVADISFAYTDPSGTTTTEADPITTSPWQQIFTATAFPATFSVTVQASLKPDVTFTKDRYVLEYAWTDEFKEYRSDGKVHWHQKADTERESVTVKRDANDPDALKSAIEMEIAKLNRTFNYTVTTDADGRDYEVEDND